MGEQDDPASVKDGKKSRNSLTPLAPEGEPFLLTFDRRILMLLLSV
jgi:hypothetical protein